MHYDNAFETTAAQLSDGAVNDRLPGVRWSNLGMLIGAAIPLLLGLVTLFRFRMDVANLPPGTVACSTPAMAGMSLILVAAPVCSLAGGLFGKIAEFIVKQLDRGDSKG